MASLPAPSTTRSALPEAIAADRQKPTDDSERMSSGWWTPADPTWPLR